MTKHSSTKVHEKADETGDCTLTSRIPKVRSGALWPTPQSASRTHRTVSPSTVPSLPQRDDPIGVRRLFVGARQAGAGRTHLTDLGAVRDHRRRQRTVARSVGCTFRAAGARDRPHGWHLDDWSHDRRQSPFSARAVRPRARYPDLDVETLMSRP